MPRDKPFHIVGIRWQFNQTRKLNKRKIETIGVTLANGVPSPTFGPSKMICKERNGSLKLTADKVRFVTVGLRKSLAPTVIEMEDKNHQTIC